MLRMFLDQQAEPTRDVHLTVISPLDPSENVVTSGSSATTSPGFFFFRFFNYSV